MTALVRRARHLPSALPGSCRCRRRWASTALGAIAAALTWALPSAGADLSVTPGGDLSATGFPLGPFAPAAQTYQLSNGGAEPLPWVAGVSAPWLSLSAAQGELSIGGAEAVSVFLNSSALYLPPGRHTASVTFANLGAPLEIVTRLVQLDIVLPAPPSVESVALRSSQLQVRVSGTPGATVIIESSTDLEAWHGERTNVLDTSLLSFDFIIAEEPQRFFRAASMGAGDLAPTLTFSNHFTYVDDPAQVRVLGEPGGTYLLEASRGFNLWAPVATQKLCGATSFGFTNTALPATGVVYRANAITPTAPELVDQILIIGQSLAIGAEGSPALTVQANPRHLRFYTEGGADYLNPLFELASETIASSAANQAGLTAPWLRLMLGNIGVGGASYAQLKRGTANYALGLEQFRRAPAALACRLLRPVPRALFCVHGEGDWNNPQYALDIRQWQADYESDLRGISGLPVDVPMFHTQMSAWTAGGTTAYALSPFQVLAEAEVNPAKTVLVGPKYFLPYSLPGGIHLNNFGYLWLGEYYGKVFKRVVMDGEIWIPLRPVSITRTGVVITARFHVPMPPLVLDTALVSDPGHYGFEYHDESGAAPAIADVELLAEEDSVRITLTEEPAPGSQPRLRYAYTGVMGQPGGPTTGPRGNLRDSDSEPSLSENPLYNWCVHFDKPVPFSTPE